MQMHIQMLHYKVLKKNANISLETCYKQNFHAWSAMHSAGDQLNQYE